MQTHRYKCVECSTRFVIAATYLDKRDNIQKDVPTSDVSWCPVCECGLVCVDDEPEEAKP